MKTHFNLGHNRTISGVKFAANISHRCRALPSLRSYFLLTTLWKWLLLLLFYMEKLREVKHFT